MKKKTLFCLTSVIALLVLVQCKSKDETSELVKETEIANTNSHKVSIKEAIDATAYSYLLVTEGDKEYWIAVPLTKVEIGKTYTYEGGMEMKKFESKDLKRTFDSVIFVEGLVDPDAVASTQTETATFKATTSTELAKGITLAKGAISLYDLFTNKEKMAGETVILTGRIVKSNPNIMSKNWVHLQDGTSYNGFNDITITTKEELAVDAIVSLKGKIVLNKDLGAGYKYDILIEDAVLIK